jgi:hypothetical protein
VQSFKLKNCHLLKAEFFVGKQKVFLVENYVAFSTPLAMEAQFFFTTSKNEICSYKVKCLQTLKWNHLITAENIMERP